MNLHRSLLGAAALGLAAMTTSAWAQPAPASNDQPENSAWVLGRAYGQVDAMLERFTNLPGTSTGAAPALGLNLPIADYFDYGFNYLYEHDSDGAYKLNENVFSNNLTGYYRFDGVAPFVSLGFGYEWQRTRSAKTGIASTYDSFIGQASTGVEVPVSQSTSLRATVGNDDGVRSRHPVDLTYGISANAWLNSTFGSYVGADYKKGYSGAKDSITYTAGVRFLFGD